MVTVAFQGVLEDLRHVSRRSQGRFRGYQGVSEDSRGFREAGSFTGASGGFRGYLDVSKGFQGHFRGLSEVAGVSRALQGLRGVPTGLRALQRVSGDSREVP